MSPNIVIGHSSTLSPFGTFPTHSSIRFIHANINIPRSVSEWNSSRDADVCVIAPTSGQLVCNNYSFAQRGCNRCEPADDGLINSGRFIGVPWEISVWIGKAFQNNRSGSAFDRLDLPEEQSCPPPVVSPPLLVAELHIRD